MQNQNIPEHKLPSEVTTNLRGTQGIAFEPLHWTAHAETHLAEKRQVSLNTNMSDKMCTKINGKE